jgi:pseudouridine 5'-phosphatase
MATHFLRRASVRLDRPVRCVVFDMDGVLLDTEIFYTRVTQQIVGRYGKTFDWTIKSHMVGRPAIESARYLVETLSLPILPEEYLAERETELAKWMPEAAPMPGAEALTRELVSAGPRRRDELVAALLRPEDDPPSRLV